MSCQPWCVIKCYTAEEDKDFEIRLDKRVTLDDINKLVQSKCGETYRCYILRGTGTLRKLRRDSEFQSLVDTCDKEVEIYVKQSRTLSITKQSHLPPTSLTFGLYDQQYKKTVFTDHSSLFKEFSIQHQISESKSPFRRGHRRTKSAHDATHHQQRQSHYIPEPAYPLTPDPLARNSFRGFHHNNGGGRFVPADRITTPDSGFQSPESVPKSNTSSYSPDSSTATTSAPYEGDIPRHLAEEFPVDSVNDHSMDSSTSFNSDYIEVDNFSDIKRRSIAMVDLHLPENYLIKNMIGSGGFAKVYHCIDQDTGRDLAVKQVFYDTQCNDSNRELKALKNEINILKRLEHPNIVVYYGSNCNDGYFNIFMEYVSGGSMRAFIQNNGPLLNKYTVKCLYHILLGLSYLHHENIIHRDLKAGNVLKTTDGTIKIADFGASKRFDTLRSINGANTVVGTPYWMAPEVIKAQSYTNRVDIWGVGVTAFEFLSGNPPFFNLEPLAAMFKIAQKRMKNELSFPSSVPDLLIDFVLSCLEHESTNRPSSDELLEHSLFSTFM